MKGWNSPIANLSTRKERWWPTDRRQRHLNHGLGTLYFQQETVDHWQRQVLERKLRGDVLGSETIGSLVCWISPYAKVVVTYTGSVCKSKSSRCPHVTVHSSASAFCAARNTEYSSHWGRVNVPVPYMLIADTISCAGHRQA
jgi:hypothetical protein